jgi:hypothetical protein
MRPRSVPAMTAKTASIFRASDNAADNASMARPRSAYRHPTPMGQIDA